MTDYGSNSSHKLIKDMSLEEFFQGLWAGIQERVNNPPSPPEFGFIDSSGIVFYPGHTRVALQVQEDDSSE